MRLRGSLRALLTVLTGLGLMVWLPLSAESAVGGQSAARAQSVVVAQSVVGAQSAARAKAAVGAAASGERILSFTADYDLASDGSLGVTETLVWQFGPGEHHGIKRNITVRQGVSSPPDKFRLYEMSDVGASSPTGANTEL